MAPPVTRDSFSLTQRLVDRGQRRDDVVRPAQRAQGKLDARAGRLLSFEEDEFVSMRDDHSGLPPPPAQAGNLLYLSKLVRSGYRLLPVWRTQKNQGADRSPPLTSH